MKSLLTFPFRLISAIPLLIIEGIKWCKDNGMKGFIVAGVVIIILAGIGGKVASCGQSSPSLSQLATATQDMPSKREAPYYAITGDSKLYYMASYHWQTGTLLIIDDYWVVKGDHWVNTGDGKSLAIANKPKVGKR